jgi:hypothetical protein
MLAVMRKTYSDLEVLGVFLTYGLLQDKFSPFISLHKKKMIKLGIARIAGFSFRPSYLFVLSDDA